MEQHDFWKNSIQAGSKAFAEQEYRRARTYYCAAARDAKNRNHGMQLAVSLHNLALIYFRGGRKNRSIGLLKAALHAARQASHSGSWLECRILDKLADLVLTRNEQDQTTTAEERQRAIDFLEDAQQVDCKIGGVYQRHLPQRLTRLACLYFRQGDFERASLRYVAACETEILTRDREVLLRNQQRSHAECNEILANLVLLPSTVDIAPAQKAVAITMI